MEVATATLNPSLRFIPSLLLFLLSLWLFVFCYVASLLAGFLSLLCANAFHPLNVPELHLVAHSRRCPW